MKKLLLNLCLISFLLIVPTVIYSQDYTKCSDFKYGKFTFPLLPEGSGYAVRDENYQISYIGNGEKQLVWEIEWIDECRYNLILKEIYSESNHWTKGDKIEVEINSFKNNCYGFKSMLTAKFLSEPSIIYDMMCKENDI